MFYAGQESVFALVPSLMPLVFIAGFRVLKKVGFVINHYDVHQVPHVVPYAFELSRLYQNVEVSVLCSTAAEMEFAREIGNGYAGHRCKIEQLDVPSLIRLVDPVLSKIVFAKKRFALTHNVELLSKFDVLVVPEITSLVLKKQKRFDNVKMVFTHHGAGDRLVSTLDEKICEFDLVFVPGEKYADRLLEMGLVTKDKLVVCGYPKFEAMETLGIKKRKLFDNDRPVVVYNPHHTKSQSSWHKMGCDILDYFYESNDYNLIFAPHTVLLKRAWSKGGVLPSRYKSNENVLIDTGSRALSDMTYLRASDIYLGDASSQVYEFLETPRPCVFLNAHQINWQNDPHYRHWTFGPVVDDIAKLDKALGQIKTDHKKYVTTQLESLEYTFSNNDVGVGVRGATAIAQMLGIGPVS